MVGQPIITEADREAAAVVANGVVFRRGNWFDGLEREIARRDAENTRLRGVVVAAEGWLAGVVSACGRALSGDLDRKTLAATLRLVVQRAQDQRAALTDVLDATSDKPEPTP